jgi:hypothetical protein
MDVYRYDRGLRRWLPAGDHIVVIRPSGDWAVRVLLRVLDALAAAGLVQRIS